MFPCIGQDFPIPIGNAAPIPFMEGSQVFALRRDMQPGLVWEKRNLNKKPGVIVKAAVQQVSNGEHGAIGGLVETAKPVFLGLGGDQLHFLFKGGISVHVHSDQAAFLFFHNADLGQIHGQQGLHIPVMVT